MHATDFKILELEGSRDLSSVWVQVDMDAVYAAVETLVNLPLAGKPMAVKGMSMICTANLEARNWCESCHARVYNSQEFKTYPHDSDLSQERWSCPYIRTLFSL